MRATTVRLHDDGASKAIRREGLIAEVSHQALIGSPIGELYDVTCTALAGVLDAHFVKILRLEPDGASLRLIAGCGWPDGVVGAATVPNDRHSQAGYTLAVGSPVVARDLRHETRFAPPSLLVEHGVLSGMSTPIRTRDGVYGVLGVHRRDPYAFTDDDTHLLVAIANVLGAAITNADARNAAHRSARMFRVLFEESSDLILLVDASTVVRAANPAALTALGYSPSEVAGASALEFIHPDDRPNAIGTLAHALAHPAEATELELRVRRRDGGWRLFHAVGRSVEVEAGTPTIVINARDITERRALEEKIAQSQQMETIGSVAAAVAHDLNNVLQVVLGSAEVLETSLASGELRDEAIQIVSSTRLASRFLRGMLSLVRPAIPADPVELNRVLAEALPLLRQLAGPAITIDVAPTTLDTRIRVDALELEQVLINLVINARDALPDGGPISIATWRVVRDDGARIVLSVADRGVGMSEDVRRRIFEPMFTTKARGRGTGLGLAIVQAIASRARAEISVVSALGAGSTFELAFPAATS